ncbi:APC family permease [Rhodocytophaga rosea]|uniref:APC family permease n=1 Tax=Rhodocytophaga rosea TaxID=2704465 RepID=A0A6C0GST8_9BACT|nr:APC family permease [Rhodocytophaga rosea]QHT71086.1 APC family permease [Rhodocytophaga rosea]
MEQLKQEVKDILATPHPHKLTELPATAICGNDISSSCLYVSALAIIYAGQYAWVALLIVSLVLYLFRSIYGEVVGALPLNGGAYNALLNTTSKATASMAACLTLLSYMATAVISASEAMHYVHILWEGLPVIWATVGVLALFMALTIMGIGESSKVAIAIFLIHLATLVLLAIACGIYLMGNGLDTLFANYQLPVKGSLVSALFFGFSAAMLGISGFESSANFVEEQASGVFPRTLRNMWIVVSIFNPLMALLALSLVPINDVGEHQEALLAYMGDLSGGKWLAWLVSIDAVLVLSGAVLTSYVGVSGLVHRMTLDRCLPQFLLKTNKRGTTYRIMIAFFLLCISILFITKGELGALAGVYTISFLSVMVLFGLGNILLKFRRARLPRPERASGWALFIAIGAVLAALIGNAVMNPAYLWVFIKYFIPTVAIVGIMLYRIELLRLILFIVKSSSAPIRKILTNKVLKESHIRRTMREINSQEFVYFTKGDNVVNINKVMQYIIKNEDTHRIKIVAIENENHKVPEHLAYDIDVLDRAYPEFVVDFIVMKGQFGPRLIDELSLKWNIPKNFMFIGSPGDRFPYQISELGGVRLII